MALRHLCLTAGPADELYTSYKTPNRVLIKHFASSGSSFINWARASSRRTSWWLPGGRQWTGQVYFIKTHHKFLFYLKIKYKTLLCHLPGLVLPVLGLARGFGFLWIPRAVPVSSLICCIELKSIVYTRPKVDKLISSSPFWWAVCRAR